LGPSGSGKSTLVTELHRLELIELTPSWTTRPLRDNEGTATIEHRFVSEREFTEQQKAGTFLEAVQLFGLSYRYGLPPLPEPAAGKVPTILVRAPLMPLVSHHFPDHVAYQIEACLDRVQSRLHQRIGADSALGTRLEDYEAERVGGRSTAHRIFVNNGAIRDLVDSVVAAIREDFPNARREQG
jgi:guanylate kinase